MLVSGRIGGSMEGKKEDSPETAALVVGMILVSLIGGILLGWWEWKFHSDYEQLWMVPLGLILLVTPIVAFSAVVISAVWCTPTAAVHSLEMDGFPET